MAPLSWGNQLIFARDFAQYSGLSGNVVLAWCLQEQPPGKPATPNSNNWLNIQYTDQGPNSTYYRIAALNPPDAARASVIWMAENLGSILAAKGKSEYLQAKAIVDSGWASSHYGGVEKFYAVVRTVATSKLEATPPAPTTAQAHYREHTENNPPERSRKIQATGKGMGERGSRFVGHSAAMRDLRRRTITLKVR